MQILHAIASAVPAASNRRADAAMGHEFNGNFHPSDGSRTVKM
jgi:hypothetical protein